jgi:hypothetical protein
MNMKNAVLLAVVGMAAALTGCGEALESADDMREQDVVSLNSSELAQQSLDINSMKVGAIAGCSRSQFNMVMEHCEYNHAPAYTCCRITSCRPIRGGISYSWSGYYAC